MSAGVPVAVEGQARVPTAVEGQAGVPAAVEGQAGGSAKRSQEDAIVPFGPEPKSRRMLDESWMSFAIAASGLWGPSPAPGFTADELQNLLCAYAGYVLSMMPWFPTPPRTRRPFVDAQCRCYLCLFGRPCIGEPVASVDFQGAGGRDARQNMYGALS